MASLGTTVGVTAKSGLYPGNMNGGYILEAIASLKERIAATERGEDGSEPISLLPDHWRCSVDSMKSLSPSAKARITNEEHNRRYRAQRVAGLRRELEHYLNEKLKLGLL